MPMTTEEAIETLSSLLADRQDLSGTSLANAIKLAIEIMKASLIDKVARRP